jgi:hypothetical protein
VKKHDEKGRSAEYTGLKRGKSLVSIGNATIKTPFKDRAMSGRSAGKK